MYVVVHFKLSLFENIFPVLSRCGAEGHRQTDCKPHHLGSTRSLSVGSVGSGSEPSTPTRLSEVLTAKSFRKAIAKKGNSLKSLKSLIIEYEPAAKKEDTPETTESKVSSVRIALARILLEAVKYLKNRVALPKSELRVITEGYEGLVCLSFQSQY